MLRLYPKKLHLGYILVLVFCLSLFAVPVINVVMPGSSSEALADDSSSLKKHSRKKGRRTRPSRNRRKAKSSKSKMVSAAGNVVGGGDDNIASFQASNTADQDKDIDAVILLDTSRSMQRTDPRRLRNDGVELFARFLSDADRLALISFDKSSELRLDLNAVSPEFRQQLSDIVLKLQAEGGWTDIDSAIKAAFELLMNKGRPGSRKIVVLLSDGKMDPHPSVGPPEQVTKSMFADQLLRFNARGIKLYTLAMSQEADRILLKKMAEQTRGNFWFAADADEVYKRFSELFLTAKNPQVVPMDAKGFMIDAGVKEATFIVSRKADQQVTLISPSKYQLTKDRYPPRVSWFAAEQFDMVSIKNPHPGQWYVNGIEDPEGFASLVTDLKLQIKWPVEGIRQGDTFQVLARLLEGESQKQSSERINGLLAMTYEIKGSNGAGSVIQGELFDDGKHGDAGAEDGIFGAQIKVPVSGKFKAYVTAKAPTFTRRQQNSFIVSPGLISLEYQPEDVFAGKPAKFVASLSKETQGMDDLEITLLAKLKGKKKALSFEMKSEGALAYQLTDLEIPKGEYDLSARLEAKGKSGKKIQAHSPVIAYTSDGAVKVDETEEKDHKASWGEIIIGILSAVALFVMGGLVFWRGSKLLAEQSKNLDVKEYTVPEELIAKIAEIKGRVSEHRRKPVSTDLTTFALVKESLLEKQQEESATSSDEDGSSEEASDAEAGNAA